MVAIANKHFFPSGTASFGADEYTAAIDSCILTPNTPVAVINDVGGNVQAVAGTPVWVAALSIAQDFVTVNSLSQWLLANAGTIKTLAYKPQSGGKTFTCSVLIVPAPVGGAGGAVAKATVSLQVIGQPTIA